MAESTKAVPRGHIATIVTHLEMLEQPEERPAPSSSLTLEGWDKPSREEYRDLFRQVGAPWLWFGRLVISDGELDTVLTDPDIAIHAIKEEDGSLCGMVELDFRVGQECEIVYLGLTPEYTGQGHGEWLMAETLRLAWRDDINRVWLHTCTLDHPGALSFYRKHGFVPFKQEIETIPDPRLTGHLPRDCAPQVPVIE